MGVTFVSKQTTKFGIKKLIQEAVDRMNYTNTNRSPKEEIVHN